LLQEPCPQAALPQEIRESDDVMLRGVD